jgi:hypothetical protein
MDKVELTDLEKITEIENQIRDTHIITEPAKVMIGRHPEHGFVVLIKTSEGALMLADHVHSMEHRTDAGPRSFQVLGR